MKGIYLTIGNLSYLYSALKDSEKNTIAKYYSEKYNKQFGIFAEKAKSLGVVDGR